MKGLVQKLVGVLLILPVLFSSLFSCMSASKNNYQSVLEASDENMDRIYLSNQLELKLLYGMIKKEVNKKFLYLDVSDNIDEGFFVVNDNLSYSFYCENTRIEKTSSSYLISKSSIYDVELGNSTEGDAPFYSFSVTFGSWGSKTIGKRLKFEFQDASLSTGNWRRMAYVYSGAKIVGEAYFAFSLDITDDQLEDFLKEHLVVLR